MKNKFAKLLIFGILSFSVVLVGCKKDEVTKNHITYDGLTYLLNNGALDSWGATSHNPLTYKFEIVLTSSGIAYNETALDYSGTGTFIKLTLYSSDPSTILPGTYTFDRFSSMDSLTMSRCLVGINQDIAISSGDGFYSINTGIVEVSKRGGIYLLNIDLYTNANKQITGYFTGLMENHTIPQNR